MPIIKEYYRPERVEEALSILNRENQLTKLLAGGTNLANAEFAHIDAVVDLQDLGLTQVNISANLIELGAMVRIKEIVQNPSMPELLKEAARREGPNTLRNVGTIGGLVVLADWESELFAALLVHRAEVTIQTQDGKQKVLLEDFSRKMASESLVVSVSLDPRGVTAAARVARTPFDSPIVAVVGRKNDAGLVYLAFCGIAGSPMMASFDELAVVTPPSDFRGSSAYRKEMATILGQRVLEQLAKE